MFGHPELTIYALFGGLAGMYGRTEPHQLRLKHQLQAAVMLVTGVMIGAGLSVTGLHSWWLVGVETLLAGLGSLLADRLNLRPSGPFFGILALGACASVPTTVPWVLAVLVAVASAASAVSVGFLGWLRKRAWRPRASRNAVPLAGARRQRAIIHAGTGQWRLQRYRLLQQMWPAAFTAESTGLWELSSDFSSSRSFCCLHLGSWTHKKTYLRW